MWHLKSSCRFSFINPTHLYVCVCVGGGGLLTSLLMMKTLQLAALTITGAQWLFDLEYQDQHLLAAGPCNDFSYTVRL